MNLEKTGKKPEETEKREEKNTIRLGRSTKVLGTSTLVLERPRNKLHLEGTYIKRHPHKQTLQLTEKPVQVQFVQTQQHFKVARAYGTISGS